MLLCAGEGKRAAGVSGGEGRGEGRGKDECCKLRASPVRVPVAGTGCVGIACYGSLAQIMQGLLPKYVFCHCFLFSGARELSPEDPDSLSASPPRLWWRSSCGRSAG